MAKRMVYRWPLRGTALLIRHGATRQCGQPCRAAVLAQAWHLLDMPCHADGHDSPPFYRVGRLGAARRASVVASPNGGVRLKTTAPTCSGGPIPTRNLGALACETVS